MLYVLMLKKSLRAYLLGFILSRVGTASSGIVTNGRIVIVGDA